MRILHVFRAPIGGLFRHVIDLAKEQAARGHEVGVFCDSTFSGERNEGLLAELATHLSLGVQRTPMSRNPNFTDMAALNRMSAFAQRAQVDVLHGHGSKGGLYARLGANRRGAGAIRAYTPHGGSLNYKPGSLIHRAYMGVEYLLERGTDVFLFESQFVADRFKEFVCDTDAVTRIVLNGLHPHELQVVEANTDAVDFLYIGEFRFAKGIDNLLDALADVRRDSARAPSLVLVGQGPDEDALRAKAKVLDIEDSVSFRKPMAARQAFQLARTMVVPSRFESMPYVVIEAAGAAMPLISTDVGGIPEIFGKASTRLIAADDIPALVRELSAAMASTASERREPALQLRSHIDENFSVAKMTTAVLGGYEEALARRNVANNGVRKAS
jgi:glycosyltransferase involved in cell wall biosynthesis